MDFSKRMEQFRLQMSKVLTPRSNGELKEATAWIESFRRASEVELVMIEMLSTPFEVPLSAGEVILLSQTLLWRVTRMAPSSLCAGVNVSALLQYAVALDSVRAAQANLYLTVATLVIRTGMQSDRATPTVLSSFLNSFTDMLDSQSVMQVLKYIPEVVTNTLLYRGNKEITDSVMTAMCSCVLQELPVVFSTFDHLISAVLEPLGLNESSFARQRGGSDSSTNREECLRGGEATYTALMDTVQATLNWMTLYTSTLERCRAASQTLQIETSLPAYCSPEYDAVWLQSKVITLALSIFRGMLLPAPPNSGSSSDCSGLFIEDDAHRLYTLCAEVVFGLLQKHWTSEDAQANVTTTILAATCTLMDDVGLYYHDMFAALYEQPNCNNNRGIAQILNSCNGIATQFESSFLGIASTVLTSESLWVTFRDFIQKFKGSDSFLENSIHQKLCQSWHQYFVSLVRFMQQFTHKFCQCGGDERACPLLHVCGGASDYIAVSESSFSVRIISIRVFQAMLPLWRGLLEDEPKGDGRAVPSEVAAVFSGGDENPGHNLIIQGMTSLILSAKITDHSCVMISLLKKDASSFGFAQSCYAQHWEEEYGDEFATFRKECRDAFRSFGCCSSIFYHSLVAQRAQVAKSDSDLDTQMLLQHPEYYRIFGSVYAHMWFFKNIISEVTSLEQVLCAAPCGEAVSGQQILTVEALLHAASAMCSGEGASVLGFISPSFLFSNDSSPDMLHLLALRNEETSRVLCDVLNTLYQFCRQLLTPVSPLVAFVSPLLRLLVVLVLDLYAPLKSHLAARRGTGEMAFEEFCNFTKSCCEWLLQSSYMPEEFHLVSPSTDHATTLSGSGCASISAPGSEVDSQRCFVGAVLPFRVKQDHIGAVSLVKLSQVIRQLARHSPTRPLIKHLSAVLTCTANSPSGLPLSVSATVLSQLLTRLPSQEQHQILPLYGETSSVLLMYSSHLYTEALPYAYHIHGTRTDSCNDVVLLWVKTFFHHLISFTHVKNGVLTSPRLSWRSLLLLHESTVNLLESVSFASFSASVESDMPCEDGADMTFLQTRSFSITHCTYWYFPIVLPAMTLLLRVLSPPALNMSVSATGAETDAGAEGIIDAMLNLCDCSERGRGGDSKKAWICACKANVGAVSDLYQQNMAIKKLVSPIQNHLAARCFFELLANSVKLSLKQSFASLQHVLTDDQASLWMKYTCLYHELSTIVSLQLSCIIPFSKRLLAMATTSLERRAQSTWAFSEDLKDDTLKGVAGLLDACCVPPAAALLCSATATSTTAAHTLQTVLTSPPPALSSCSPSSPVTEFGHVMECFQELCGVVVNMMDVYVVAIAAVDAAGDAQVAAHFRGLIASLHSTVKIIKAFSQWPSLIGDRLGLCQYVFGLVTTKVFAVVGWNEESCSCYSSVRIPEELYGTLLLFWIQCLEFQQQEITARQQEQGWNNLPTSNSAAAHYPCATTPHEQTCAMIRFTLSAGAHFQAIWGDSNTDKYRVQVMHMFFTRYIQVLSLCLGGLPNLVTPHTLDADGLITPSCLNNVQNTENPCGEHSLIEHLYISGVGKALIHSVISLLRDALCPVTVKDSSMRLLCKCLMAFGTTLSAEYVQSSAFQSVGESVIKLSLGGQWKKIKNVVKTISK